MGREKIKKRGLAVTSTKNLIGSFPSDVKDSLIRAVESVPEGCFFDGSGNPLKKEVQGLDKGMAGALTGYGWNFESNFCPFPDCGFTVDLALKDHKVLIEIEKGKSPRLELDVLKIASACLKNPKHWRFGVLVVPSSYIKLPLAGRQFTYHYLQNLAPLIEPLLDACSVKGFLVIGYDDPRSHHGEAAG